MALSNFLLTGKNCVPSPHGIKADWKATPSMVPLTLTDLVEPKNVADSGHTTRAQPLRFSMAALNVLLIGDTCPMSRLLFSFDLGRPILLLVRFPYVREFIGRITYFS